MNTIDPKHNLLLIHLSKLKGDESKEEIYNRTRFAWKTNFDRASNVDYVISHNSDEEIVGIFRPIEWLKGDDKEFKSLDRGSYPDRIGFIGEEAPEEIQEMYRDSSTPPRKKGAANPIRYLESTDEEDEDLDLEELFGDLEFDEDDHDEESQDSNNLVNHTYLAGVALDDEEIDDLVSSAYKFLDEAYRRLHLGLDREPPQIYLVGNKKSGDDFLNSAENLEFIKIFQGTTLREDAEPNEDDIRKFFEENSKLTFMDDGYWKIWFAFQYPEENSEDFEDPGEHWEQIFQKLADGLPDLTLVGYNSEIEEIIWQEWNEGEYDEGAISNPDSSDYYSGSSVENEHSVNLECFKILN